MTKKIHYGFGLDYLKDWGIEQALREIYQSFLDYAAFREKVKPHARKSNIVEVTISNDWKPENLTFLRIGKSVKQEGAIGKHGEGIKMAFMILYRNGYKSQII